MKDKQMKVYKVRVAEIKATNFSIKANTSEEAKEMAFWRLHTQTQPPIKPKTYYEVTEYEMF